MAERLALNQEVGGSIPSPRTNMNKLKNFPQVTYINIDSHIKKRNFVESKFKQFNISNYKRFNAITPPISTYKNLNIGEVGCMLSHLHIIFDFYNNKDDMAIIVEDDIDISTINNWEFSWQEFIDSVPEFEIIQLLRNQEPDNQMYAKLKWWDWEDKSTAAYLITKDYAKKMIDTCKDLQDAINNLPNLSDEPEWPWNHQVGPVADYALYKNFKTLSTCIFQQTHSLDSVWSSTSPNQEPEWYTIQHNQILEYWSKPHGLDDII